jgi:hypothetical protein
MLSPRHPGRDTDKERRAAMNNLYDLHSYSKLYREERLAEVSRRHLVERARANREPRESGRLRLPWRNALALLRGV